MATKLQLKFGTLSGEKTWSFSDIDPETADSTVRALISGMIDNGSIYAYPPLSAVSAKFVTTTDRTVNLNP